MEGDLIELEVMIQELADELSSELGRKMIDVVTEFEKRHKDLSENYKRAIRIEAIKSITLAWLSYEAITSAELIGIIYTMLQTAYQNRNRVVEAKMQIQMLEQGGEEDGKEE